MSRQTRKWVITLVLWWVFASVFVFYIGPRLNGNFWETFQLHIVMTSMIIGWILVIPTQESMIQDDKNKRSKNHEQ